MSILILTHGNLAAELLAAAEVIAGKQPGLEAVILDWKDSFEAAQQKLRQALDRHDPDDEILILTDIYGGTPCNVALTFAEPGRVEVVTGVNLPMVVRLSCRQSQQVNGEAMSTAELAAWLRTKGQQSICVATSKAMAQHTPCAPQPCDERQGHSEGAGSKP